VEGRRPTPAELDARLYGLRSIGWPGELAFDLDPTPTGGGSPRVLEIACGTGRLTLQLAAAGRIVTGIDTSAAVLDVARSHAAGGNPRLVEADMRTFDPGEPFDAVIVPAHAFQFMTTPDDQAAALERFRAHLAPGGRLAIHVDHDSIASLGGMDGSERRGRPIEEPGSGRRFRGAFAWTYDHAWQNATLRMAWEELDRDDRVVDRWDLDPMTLHVAPAAEMEHALRRAGFGQTWVAGDFFGGPLRADSGDMVWAAVR